MQRLPFLILVFFCLGINQIAFVQTNHWEMWENTSNPDTVRLEGIKQHIWENYLFSDRDSALILNQQQLDYAIKTESYEYESSAYNTKGTSYYLGGDLDSAYFYFEKAFELNVKIGNKEGAASNKTNLASVLMDMGLYKEANALYFESLAELEKGNDRFKESQVLNNIGMVYDYMGYYDKAIDYYLKSIKLLMEAGREDQLVSSYINIGTACTSLDRVEEGAENYQKAYDIARELGDERGMASALQSLGKCYHAMGDNEKAIKNLFTALEYFQKVNIPHQIATCMVGLENIYRKEGKYEVALNYGLEALDYAYQEEGVYLMYETSQSLYLTYRGMENYEEALKMFEVSAWLNDSITALENKSAVLEQGYQYEYDQQVLLDSIEFENKSRLKNLELQEQKSQLNKERIQRYALWGGVGAFALLAIILFRNYQRKKADNELIGAQKVEVEAQRDIAEKQRVEIDHQHQELNETHKEITDSINYAKHLQDAILPSLEEIKKNIVDSFVLFNPKDVVSGDFFWFETAELEGKTIRFIAAADCTGHGVPGSLVSVVCSGALNRSVKEFGLTSPAAILNKTRELVVETFAKSGESVRDGMDIALCAFHGDSLVFCGANNPLWIVRDAAHVLPEQLEQRGTAVKDNLVLFEIAANRQPVGKDENLKPFEEHKVSLIKGDSLYMFSDGFADQFGEVTGKKFKKKPFKELILNMNNQPMELQETLLHQAFNVWKGNLEQIDDVCVIGVRI